jgi:signal peptidase I
MKTLKTIVKVIYNLLFVLLLVSASFILLTTYDVIPGYNFYVVMSGSMEPEIKIGSVVGIKEQEEYEVDDVVTVQMPYSEWETYTHRII